MVIDPVTVYSKQIITGLVTEFRMLSKILISTYVRQNYQLDCHTIVAKRYRPAKEGKRRVE